MTTIRCVDHDKQIKLSTAGLLSHVEDESYCRSGEFEVAQIFRGDAMLLLLAQLGNEYFEKMGMQ